VLERWRTDRPYGLLHPIGIGADGVFKIDLVADGPHALIGGTSGAGKSELLQSMVASMISLYPPTRLNFLFVDYKGGASSTVFQSAPHTVGYVTNLNASLSLRALISLRAELDRRMRLLEGRAKDLPEMMAKYPNEAPPSLVIVVDEFATLVKEIPEFVAGIVDIAQRGRSLGIHLILATQRPSGSVNDNILANTNLRISLRMLDAGESASIIGTSEAADIPVPLRGRGFARLGPRDLFAFQSAYAGAPVQRSNSDNPIVVEAFDLEPTGRSEVAAGKMTEGANANTQLDLLMAAVVEATRQSNYAPSRPPWREVLPEHLELEVVRVDDRAAQCRTDPGRHVVLGLLDEPALQDQSPAIVDLEQGGGLLVVGSGGSGKTTLLRTLAASVTLDAPDGGVVVFGLDFGSRALRSIQSLPTVANVATGDDLEAVTRVIGVLSSELERRRALLADAQAENLTTYLGQGHRLDRVVVLVDGYLNLVETMRGGGYLSSLESWLDAFHKIVTDGRQVGIHTVLTADRRTGIPGLIHSAVSNRVVLRQADDNGYLDNGIPAARYRGVELAPGRAFWNGVELAQIACVASSADGQAQATALGALGGQLRPLESALRSSPLPESIALADLSAASSPLTTTIGIADVTLQPVTVDLTWNDLVITGPPRSGRSSALATVAAGLAGRHRVITLGTVASPLAKFGIGEGFFGRPEDIAPTLEAAIGVAEASNTLTVLCVDDVERFADAPELAGVWERVARLERLRLVATVEPKLINGYTSSPLGTRAKNSATILLLQPVDASETLQLTGIKGGVRPGLPLPPGRGLLVADRLPTLVHVAITDTGLRPGEA
jgi:DNA segregation ATPase FtsK/SpoIIIE, S-DNA-T family